MSRTDSPDVSVVDNPADHRFEARIGGQLAVNQYDLRGDTIIFTGTEVPEALRGRGIGERLARAGLDAARERGLTVIAQCPFVAAYVRKHDEYADLLA